MKFRPAPIIRYCYRYFFVALFILFPIYITFGISFNSKIINEEEWLGWFLLGVVFLTFGSLLIHFAFWESFFSTLEITDEWIIWRCPFRKTQRMLLDQCVVIGACKEHINNGIPSECIFFSDVATQMNDTDLRGTLKRSSHLIKYAYSDILCDYLLQKVPDKRTRILGAYRWRRNKQKK